MRQGHSSLGGAVERSTTSPPVSPRPRLVKRFFGVEKRSNLVEKLVSLVVSCVFRKKGVLLFAPVFYIPGILVFMGLFGFDVGVSLRGCSGRGESWPAPPGLVYRSPEVFRELWPFMEAEVSNSTDNAICNVVAVAGLLNATAIIPIFHLNSVRRDSSKVRVLRQLPEDVLQRYDHNISSIINLRVKSWSRPSHYLQKVLPKMKEHGAVLYGYAPFGNRLAQVIPSYVQGLRCFANFEALRFAEYIRTLGERMVERMTRKSSGHEGRYVSVYLPFEKVGMMLRGMGLENMTFSYIASGKIYDEDKYMAPLKMMFPNLQTKETRSSPEELAPLQGFSSRLATIDYTVCLHSEVFVTTRRGNFPHFLIGHRHYLFGGHAKTIRPDKRKLALLLDNPEIRWEYFKGRCKRCFVAATPRVSN